MSLKVFGVSALARAMVAVSGFGLIVVPAAVAVAQAPVDPVEALAEEIADAVAAALVETEGQTEAQQEAAVTAAIARVTADQPPAVVAAALTRSATLLAAQGIVAPVVVNAITLAQNDAQQLVADAPAAGPQNTDQGNQDPVADLGAPPTTQSTPTYTGQ